MLSWSHWSVCLVNNIIPASPALRFSSSELSYFNGLAPATFLVSLLASVGKEIFWFWDESTMFYWNCEVSCFKGIKIKRTKFTWQFLRSQWPECEGEGRWPVFLVSTTTTSCSASLSLTTSNSWYPHPAACLRQHVLSYQISVADRFYYKV